MQQKVTIKPSLRDLEIGQSVSFPISKTISVRTSASELGLTLQRVYKTFTDRDSARVVVVRIQ